MRPAVAISFCLPVKYGGNRGETSTLMPLPVERVSHSFPQAQCTLTVWYFGWISAFMAHRLESMVAAASGACPGGTRSEKPVIYPQVHDRSTRRAGGSWTAAD